MGVDNRINELRGNNGLTDGKGDMVKSPKDVIEKGLEKAFPQISKEEKEIAVRKVAMNEDGKVSIGGKEINVGELDLPLPIRCKLLMLRPILDMNILNGLMKVLRLLEI